MNFQQRLLLIFCILGIFASGGITGWFLRPVMIPDSVPTTVMIEKRLPSPSKTIDSLDTRLHFTKEQRTALQPIIEEWASAARAAEMPMREKRYEALKIAVPKIRAVLNPEQQTRFDRMIRSVTAEWERRTHRGQD